MPIVCADHRADSFNDHHALVQITAPFHQAVPEHTVILLLEDLHLFTQTWYYSALSYPMLNDRLCTAFVLRDPDMDDIDEGDEKDLPLALQRQLLLPFGQVKGLYSMEISGFNEAVQLELRKAQAIPPPTLQQSCEQATALLHEGDAHLARGPSHAPTALETYTRAFHAIHILIAGRTRRVLADTFFHATIPSGPYAGQTGMTVRVILRLKLVARIIAAHLARAAPADAAFWGMRSVRIMAEAMDTEFEDFLADLVGGDDVGLVYARAGLALWIMRADEQRWGEALAEYEGEDMADVRVLWRMSLKHFKRGTHAVKEEMAGFGVPRGLLEVFGERAASEDGSVMVNVHSGDVAGSGEGGGWGGEW